MLFQNLIANKLRNCKNGFGIVIGYNDGKIFANKKLWISVSDVNSAISRKISKIHLKKTPPKQDSSTDKLKEIKCKQLRCSYEPHLVMPRRIFKYSMVWVAKLSAFYKRKTLIDSPSAIAKLYLWSRNFT